MTPPLSVNSSGLWLPAISKDSVHSSAQALFHSYQWDALLDKNGSFNCLKSSSQQLLAGTMELERDPEEFLIQGVYHFKLALPPRNPSSFTESLRTLTCSHQSNPFDEPCLHIEENISLQSAPTVQLTNSKTQPSAVPRPGTGLKRDLFALLLLLQEPKRPLLT